MPLIPTLRRQRHVDLCEFKASLVYRASSRTGSKATEKPCFEKPKGRKKEKKNKTVQILTATDEHLGAAGTHPMRIPPAPAPAKVDLSC